MKTRSGIRSNVLLFTIFWFLVGFFGAGCGSESPGLPDGGTSDADASNDSDFGDTTLSDGADEQSLDEGDQEIPEKYREYFIQANAWLDQKLVDWKPVTYRPMEFGGHMIFASEQVIEETKDVPWVDAKFLDLFIEDLSADTISLFLYPYNYTKYQERYQKIFDRVRASKKKLYVAYMIGAVPRTFEEYRTEQKTFTDSFIGAVKPEYYVIVDEYTTIAKRGGFENTEELEAKWKTLVEELAASVKAASPSTKTIATGHALELDFLKGLTELANLDMIGLNVWGSTNIGKTDERMGQMADFAKSKGKGVIFEQTWAMLLDEPEAREINNMDFTSNINAKYIRVLAYYGQGHQVDLYSPFYTGKLFIHDTSDPATVLEAFAGGQRSPEYQAYKETIDEIRGAQ